MVGVDSEIFGKGGHFQLLEGSWGLVANSGAGSFGSCPEPQQCLPSLSERLFATTQMLQLKAKLRMGASTLVFGSCDPALRKDVGPLGPPEAISPVRISLHFYNRKPAS